MLSRDRRSSSCWWLPCLAGCKPGPHDERRLGFDVVTDESLRHAAEQLATWRKEKRLQARRSISMCPRKWVHYFAWFGDDARGFMDQRLDLYGTAAEDYRIIREGLVKASTKGVTAKTPWRPIFAKRKMSLVVFHSPNLASRSAELRSADPDAGDQGGMGEIRSSRRGHGRVRLEGSGGPAPSSLRRAGRQRSAPGVRTQGRARSGEARGARSRPRLVRSPAGGRTPPFAGGR